MACCIYYMGFMVAWKVRREEQDIAYCHIVREHEPPHAAGRWFSVTLPWLLAVRSLINMGPRLHNKWKCREQIYISNGEQENYQPITEHIFWFFSMPQTNLLTVSQSPAQMLFFFLLINLILFINGSRSSLFTTTRANGYPFQSSSVMGSPLQTFMKTLYHSTHAFVFKTHA